MIFILRPDWHQTGWIPGGGVMFHFVGLSQSL